jgi:hypothetical protein
MNKIRVGIIGMGLIGKQVPIIIRCNLFYIGGAENRVNHKFCKVFSYVCSAI